VSPASLWLGGSGQSLPDSPAAIVSLLAYRPFCCLMAPAVAYSEVTDVMMSATVTPADDWPLRNPISGNVFCARAASGHAAAVPSHAMN
jgi:hypothetical protein